MIIIALAYMDAVVSKAMLGTACDLIMDAYKMEIPVMKSSCIPTLNDAISKQKWAVDANTVKRILDFEKNIQSINGDDLRWLQPHSCDIVLEDIALPLPLRNSIYAFPTNALEDLLVLQALPNVPVRPENSLEELMSVFSKWIRRKEQSIDRWSL
ncbi:hypothetical protein NQZ79_g7852 [Umbelopsis isabellina]|nr:hypothetical protein NQZ79_g7852 [Umbelopsis isabellina]